MITDKIVNIDKLIKEISIDKYFKRKIIFTNGCFDLLHIGHLTYLNKAKEYGDILIVGLNSDKSVKRLKGKNRPINSENDRAYILASMESIDYVIIFDEDTPYNIIDKIKPNILIKGNDYKIEEIAGNDIVRNNGGEVILIPIIKNISTTNIINKIKEIK